MDDSLFIFCMSEVIPSPTDGCSIDKESLLLRDKDF